MPYRGVFHYYVAYFFIGNRFGFSFSQQKEILCVFPGFMGANVNLTGVSPTDTAKDFIFNADSSLAFKDVTIPFLFNSFSRIRTAVLREPRQSRRL